MTSGQAGKGDRYRYVDPKKWKENWEKAFGEKKKNKEKQKCKPHLVKHIFVIVNTI